MKNIVFFICCLVFTSKTLAQNLIPFKIYSASGKPVSEKYFFKKLSQSNIILFGELHDNSIAHWLQLKLVKQLHTKNQVIVGMEMFETDNQEFLNQYLSKQISVKQLDSLGRLWNNFKTDYQPLVDYCKENNLPVIASNIPRRYASLLFKQGEQALLNLPDTDKQWFPSLPMPYDESLPAYTAMLKMFGDPIHANKNFPKSQAIKDYTMATNILKHYQNHAIFVHLNGSYHSNNFEGIYWYLKHFEPNLRVVTIATVLQADLNKLDLENKNIADFIIVIDMDMTRTY
jgi:uncharacterized iron-regulated protein